jgi:hypothetical protein
MLSPPHSPTPSPRQRPAPRFVWVSTAGALVLLLAGVVSPLASDAGSRQLADQIVLDLQRLRVAVEAYARDTGELPPAVFDLGEGYDGGLSDTTFVPWRLRKTWRGPYLEPRLLPPLPSCFWSLAEPCHMQDGDGDGESDEVWGRLHRGHGTLDAALAQALDERLDDGDPATGVLRVTPAWIWYQLIEG